ncbi:MAG TPA: class I SAM-dependent methyltransferase [Xanthomonadales bacterium]|nr:class I SAM-dependent methyltransferase [Xanthomonadales bacterium]
MLRKSKQSELADRHDLYQRSVQDTESEIDFIEQTWTDLRDRPAEVLREDFCGTANTACEWVRRNAGHFAIGVDLDGEVMRWGERNNVARLAPDEQTRIELIQTDVLDELAETADIVLAMNFSYFLFRTRAELLEYFASVHQGLTEDGIFFLDAYGGYDAPREIVESRECDGFVYIWEQAEFNPIDSTMTCHIHFEFADDSRLEQAFSYRWRLWTLPEIREVLYQAGFRKVDVYWEGTDEETQEGNGVYAPAEVGDADAGWVCYIVAQA